MRLRPWSTTGEGARLSLHVSVRASSSECCAWGMQGSTEPGRSSARFPLQLRCGCSHGGSCAWCHQRVYCNLLLAMVCCICRTFTTSYAGSVEREGAASSSGGANGSSSNDGAARPAAADGSSAAAGAQQAGQAQQGGTAGAAAAPLPQWQASSEQIQRAMLTSRDPILFYDELPLYESELDDHGSSRVSLKASTHCALLWWAAVLVEQAVPALGCAGRLLLCCLLAHACRHAIRPFLNCTAACPCADARDAALLVRAAALLAARRPRHGPAAGGAHLLQVKACRPTAWGLKNTALPGTAHRAVLRQALPCPALPCLPFLRPHLLCSPRLHICRSACSASLMAPPAALWCCVR